ncbi:hypothetical protein [Pseudofrankia sp. BMG5.37]|uniref:hypothetical protein n=1 Tax=Pseudofrankia sp. BMG5.37 TaxID=3050035 RepID=UPI002893BBE5|nr:hypothetical protein [Pseudofrankia sp. BMG5.37]MDT3442130.1 hypothetical protein [Pseudofrankia sp. BMG5.37]
MTSSRLNVAEATVDDSPLLSPDEDRLVRGRFDAAVRGLDPARLSVLSWYLAERLLRLTDPVAVERRGPRVRRTPRRRQHRAPGDREGTWAWWGLAALTFLFAGLLLLASTLLPPTDRCPLVIVGASALAAVLLFFWIGWLRVDDGLVTAVLLAPYVLAREILAAVQQPVDIIARAVDDAQGLVRWVRRWLDDERLRARARRTARRLGARQLRVLVARLDDHLAACADGADH